MCTYGGARLFPMGPSGDNVCPTAGAPRMGPVWERARRPGTAFGWDLSVVSRVGPLWGTTTWVPSEEKDSLGFKQPQHRLGAGQLRGFANFRERAATLIKELPSRSPVAARQRNL